MEPQTQSIARCQGTATTAKARTAAPISRHDRAIRCGLTSWNRTKAAAGNPAGKWHSWRTAILPYVEQDNLQRVQVKKMIRDWERQYPGRIDNMFTAMGNITLSHMMDRNLYPFTSIRPTGVADPAGDKAFDDDDEACAPPPASAVVRLQRDD